VKQNYTPHIDKLKLNDTIGEIKVKITNKEHSLFQQCFELFKMEDLKPDFFVLSLNGKILPDELQLNEIYF
jgi:hypothetical protein